jgi:AraC family transcriptional regulator, regulatory protein of adaptative response / methylated-DNA-[protein]-cysteine methyltransferase
MSKLPTLDTMRKAFAERDSHFEGVFYTGVKTTGIFCRPTCTARKPLPENVEFFANPQEALYAGYRPCLRCKPMDASANASGVVTRLCEVLEKAPERKVGADDLRKMGIDPSTARRRFQRAYGMTFNAYQRARRMGLALNDIRQGESVIATQLNNGFESPSGFWEAFKIVFGAPPSKSGSVKCVQAKWIDTPLGAMLALADAEGLHLLEFVDRRGLENELLALRKRTKCVIVPGSNGHLDAIAAELKQYFGGGLERFSVPLVIGGSPFEKAVWTELQTIQSGETRSYAEMAKRIGKPGASRGVGRANGRNILALVIPCHRVIKADGTLCGYGGGVWRKKWLLDHERKIISPLEKL